MDYWLGMGVDGLRLDAVPYLFKRENTSCENLPETHRFLKELRSHIDERFKNRMLLAEANQWPEDALAYFGAGDECQMAFHFPIMPRMFMGIYMEDRNPLSSILMQTPEIPENAQWSLFLRNHDELTLEMVTDEERNFLYKTYAQDPQAKINLGIRRRLAPLLGNNRRKLELMNSLLFALPGSPVIYYGDEIGMGDNIYLGDRNGVRTPMQWNSDRNAGFSKAHPQKLILPVNIDPEYHYETVNVEAQQNNPSSLLWWMKRMIALVKRYKAFGRGSLELLFPKNRKIFAFIRQYEQETILVTANLSRFVQYAHLDLSKFKGLIPVELFGRTKFPLITDSPYFLTLGPHAFYWFSLESESSKINLETQKDSSDSQKKVWIEIEENWKILLEEEKGKLEKLLPDFLREKNWFGGKNREIKTVSIQDYFPVSEQKPGPAPANEYFILFLQVEYREGAGEIYLLPLGVSFEEKEEPLKFEDSKVILAHLKIIEKGEEKLGVLYDSFYDKTFCLLLLNLAAEKKRIKGKLGKTFSSVFKLFKEKERGLSKGELPVSILEKTNSTAVFGTQWILKLFHRIEQGISPEVEMRRTLMSKSSFRHFPPLEGYLAYRSNSGSELTLAVLQSYIPNQGDAWEYTRDQIEHFFEKVLALPSGSEPPLSLLDSYLPTAELLGKEIASLHTALASIQDDPDFLPEPFTLFYQKALYQSLKNQIAGGISSAQEYLQEQGGKISPEIQPQLSSMIKQEEKIYEALQPLLTRKISGYRIRCHGDLHLKQFLYTGKEFVILDFEGEITRPFSERKMKRSPLLDVAGITASFHDVVYAALFRQSQQGVPPEKLSLLEKWGKVWSKIISEKFLKSYQESLSSNPVLIPQPLKEVQELLLIYWIEKVFYRLIYTLNYRPNSLKIQLERILRVVESIS